MIDIKLQEIQFQCKSGEIWLLHPAPLSDSDPGFELKCVLPSHSSEENKRKHYYSAFSFPFGWFGTEKK